LQLSLVTLKSLILISFFAFCSTSQASKIGDMASDFTIQSTDEKLFKLSDFKGKKPVYLIFWNTWCPFCIKKMPMYQEIYSFNGDDIEVLAINTSNKDSYKNMLSFIERHQLDIPMAFDFGQKISKQYQVKVTPTVLIIDINGVVRHRNNVPDDIDPLITEWSKIDR